MDCVALYFCVCGLSLLLELRRGMDKGGYCCCQGMGQVLGCFWGDRGFRLRACILCLRYSWPTDLSWLAENMRMV